MKKVVGWIANFSNKAIAVVDHIKSVVDFFEAINDGLTAFNARLNRDKKPQNQIDTTNN